MMKKQKKKHKHKKPSSEEILEKFRVVMKEVDHLNFENKFQALLKIQNHMFNYMKTESDKQEMGKTQMKLVAKRYSHNNYKN